MKTVKEIREHYELGCSDHSCVWGHPGGMGTNGGCKCIRYIRDFTGPELGKVNSAIRSIVRLAEDARRTALLEAADYVSRFGYMGVAQQGLRDLAERKDV
jgi:hypothetical protein